MRLTLIKLLLFVSPALMPALIAGLVVTYGGRASAAPPKGAPPSESESASDDAVSEESSESSDGAAPAPEPEAELQGDESADSTSDSSAKSDDEPEAADKDAKEGDEPASKSSKKTKKPEEAPEPPGGTLADRIKNAAATAKLPEPTAFHGIRAGRSTVEELHKAWGAPLTAMRQKQIMRETYHLDDADAVEVQCFHNKVQSVTVNFDPHPRWKELAAELDMNEIESVEVHDEFGELMGVALPESGVLVAFEPKRKERLVTQMIYDAVDPQTFILRAERRMARDCAGCQADLDMALAIDPQFARAYWLRARLWREGGQVERATKAIDEAVKLEPNNAQYRRTRGALLADAGQYIKAIEETKRALELCAAQPELKACVLNQLGEQLAAGPGRDYKKALPLHVSAIKLAEPLTQDRRATVRRMAKEAVLTAHLCAARNIAWGDWKMKKKMVPAWLNRADELAADMEDDPGALPTGLRVCREALMACVGMEGDLDPTPWIEKALTAANPAIAASTDPLRKRQLDWELGSALYDALQVYHANGETSQAMKYGTLAVEHLEAGSEDRQLEPVEAYLLGRLYYRMGAVCAMSLKEPGKAVIWFERAIPLLERPIPAAALSDEGRHGESFVSMAVSYWADGNHDEAMRLTREGLKLMEQAVKDGYLDEESLRVPYTNLSTMHRFLGNDEQAESYNGMALKALGTRR